ncbi:MAG TPA: hypothetical protein VF485_14080 [Sphingomonas sp.]
MRWNVGDWSLDAAASVFLGDALTRWSGQESDRIVGRRDGGANRPLKIISYDYPSVRIFLLQIIEQLRSL